MNNNHTKIFITVSLVIVLAILMLPKKTTVPPVVIPTVSTGSTASVCTTGWLPVCGADGKTYANSCTAEKIARVKIASTGECKDEAKPTESTRPETINSESTGVISSSESMSPTTSEPPSLSPDSETSLSGTVNTSTGSTQSGSSLVPYYNTNFHYGFSLPKKSYYSGFGSQAGANHTVGISTETGVESLTESEVRVYFYRNTVLDELKGVESNSFTDPATGTVYILLDQKNSVKIESISPQSPIVQAIVETVHMGE